MKTQQYRFLVLVPHPEIRQKIRAWSERLYSAGLWGAWSFPHAAPLALLSRALNPAELKRCASLLRTENPGSGNSTGNCTIRSLAPARSALNGDVDIFGLELDIHTERLEQSLAVGKILRRLSPPVLGAALVPKTCDECPPSPTFTAQAHTGAHRNDVSPMVEHPRLVFSAAALANMSFEPLPSSSPHAGRNYSFRWKIGRLYWLPSAKRHSGFNDS